MHQGGGADLQKSKTNHRQKCTGRMNDNAHNQDHNITKRATKTTHKNYNINTKI